MTLIDRLSKLEGPDPKIDAEIAIQLLGYTRVNRMEKWPEAKPIWDFYEGEPFNSNGVLIPKYTASVDAAIALAERVLPGWDWGKDDNGFMYLYQPDTDDCISVQAATPAIALCIAILRAKEAKNG